MRAWHKFESLPVLAVDAAPRGASTSYSDHAADMGGYGADAAYADKDSFFRAYYFGFRDGIYEYYDAFLRRHLKREDRTLSLGCGRCANEVRLFDDGFDVTGSDLGTPDSLDSLTALFPGFRYIELDARNLVASQRYDQILALDFLFVFDRAELETFLRQSAALVEVGGGLSVVYGGAADNWILRFWDRIYLRWEAVAHSVLGSLVRPYRFQTNRKHHGYRIGNAELVQCARDYGFHLVEMQVRDPLTELRRSRFVRLVTDRSALARHIAHLVGRRIPYVRMMYFEKRADG